MPKIPAAPLFDHGADARPTPALSPRRQVTFTVLPARMPVFPPNRLRLRTKVCRRLVRLDRGSEEDNLGWGGTVLARRKMVEWAY